MLVLNDHEFLRAVDFVRNHYGINLEKSTPLFRRGWPLILNIRGIRRSESILTRSFPTRTASKPSP